MKPTVKLWPAVALLSVAVMGLADLFIANLALSGLLGTATFAGLMLVETEVA
jgi:hypothetical protein